MNETDGTGPVGGKDRIIINCGGVRHETFRSTLRNFPDTRLAWCTESTANNPDYDPEKQEFFFDRHPGVFAQIINYYRTGKLHTPNDVCGPMFEEELGFWGIDEKQMEPCCWAHYTQHREAQENLKVFEGADLSDEENYSDDDMISNEAQSSSLWQKYRPKIWSVMEDFRSSKMAKAMVAVSMAFIVLSVSAYCFKTLKAVDSSTEIKNAFIYIEYICGVWFTFEFGLRIASSPNKLEFISQPMNWVDFLAILPFYLDFIPGITDGVIEILALIRLLRLFRFFKLNLGLQILKHTMVASMRELFLLVLLIMIPVVIFASVVYLTEKKDNGLKFTSIPQAFWWAVVTITTVGYGDLVPETTLGQIFGSLCAGCSVIITALPISIIGSNFSLYYAHAQARLKLPKKARKALFGAANALVAQSSRPSDDLSMEKGDGFPADQTPNRRSTININGAVVTEDGSPLGGYRRARRTRSSLYAGGMVPISRPGRTRSNEELTQDVRSETQLQHEVERKKSQSSTQSTLLESPPKSPPHYGNTLTVDPPSTDETVIDFQCLLNEKETINESLDPENDSIELEVSKIQKSSVNGVPRPGTPVRRSKNRVGFVKPTLTVTLDIGDMSQAAVNENVDELEDEESFVLGNKTRNNDEPSSKKRWTNFRGGEMLSMTMSDKNSGETDT